MSAHRRLWDDPANVLLLGTMPDAELGRQLEVSQPTVRVAWHPSVRSARPATGT